MNRYRPTNVPYRKWHQIHPHELAVNHIIPAGTPLDHIKQASVLPNPIGGESNLDRLPLMVRAYLENVQAVIGRVPYQLRRLVVSVEDSPVATVGLNDALLGPGVDPLEGSPNVKLRKLGTEGHAPDFQL